MSHVTESVKAKTIDTVKINQQYYLEVFIDSTFTCLLNEQGDTIIAAQDYYHDLDLTDINKDGYKDLRVYFVSNTPNQCDNYLFNPKLKKFRLVENCYLDIEKVKGSDFYFSYNRAGCADMNWESYLSKIENDTLVHYGYIKGTGCKSNTSQTLEIYKITDPVNENKILIKTFPYQDFIPKHGDKLDFIKTYWAEHYKLFQ